MRILIGTFVLLLLTSGINSAGSNPASDNSENVPRDVYNVGEIKISLLKPDEFQSYYGSVWVPLDGGEFIEKNDIDFVGSEFVAKSGMTKLPDARGKFLRMVNLEAKGEAFDPAGEREPGSYQADELKSHHHTIRVHKEHHGGEVVNWGHHANPRGFAETTSTGGKETRPKNIAVIYYIKIDSCDQNENVCL